MVVLVTEMAMALAATLEDVLVVRIWVAMATPVDVQVGRTLAQVATPVDAQVVRTWDPMVTPEVAQVVRTWVLVATPVVAQEVRTCQKKANQPETETEAPFTCKPGGDWSWGECSTWSGASSVIEIFALDPA